MRTYYKILFPCLFIKTLTHYFVKLLSRTKTTYENIDVDEPDLEKVSSFGKTEGCKYILLGTVKRDKDIVISVRAVDVQTAQIIFSMSESVKRKDKSSLQPAAAKDCTA